jgi:protein-disulfide isomerase
MESLRKQMVSAGLLALALGFGLLALQPTVANGQATAPVENLIRFSSPTMGPTDAKVHIVEFLDPACETCAAFFPLVKAIMAEHKGKVRLSVRHLAFHKNSDFVVRALEASRKQGKYWETLGGLFAAQSTWAVNHVVQPPQVLAVLGKLGLDMPRLQTDMAAPAIGQLIAQDLADAKALKVTQTPEYFVNGKRLDKFGEEQLRNLVRDQVKAAYR